MRALLLAAIALPALAWQKPHEQITRAAFASLPAAMRERWRAEVENLAARYSWYPDWHQGPDREQIRVYVEKPGGEVMHNVTWDRQADLATLELLLYAIARHDRAGSIEHAARYAGVLSHFLADSTCPAHALAPEDSQLNLVKDLLNLGGARDGSLHEYLERTAPAVTLEGRAPVKLGETISEAARTLLIRTYVVIRANRAALLDLVRAAESRDEEAVNRERGRAALAAARLIADALYTAATVEISLPR
ncbi:MAG: zinc dependent phospholipase C family protein [Bryobacteraceae bacterium]